MSTQANHNGFRPRAAEETCGRIDGCEYCSDCGLPFADDELTEVNGEHYCEKCLQANAKLGVAERNNEQEK